MPTTFANTIDGNEILAKRSQCDYAGNDLQTTYATKNELPTATSDLTNDSGFITSSDIPVKDVQVSGTSVVNAQGIAEISIPQTGVLDVEVNGSSVVNAQGVAEIALPTFTQVNADWDASSGVQEILNKPDLSIYAESSDLATVAISGSYNDLLEKPSIPAAQVNADWDATSGVSEILNKPQLSTVATTGDYFDLQNLPSIPAAQVNSDWDATSGIAEILNKPTIPSGTQLVPAATSADADKVLTVDSQGTPAWASAQAPITAGNGIDITNNVVSVDTSVVATQTDLAGKEDAFDVGTGLEMDTSGATPTLQVETPVDIVAGPGIVIDNPDGNTLRVSVAQAEEVVLWNGEQLAGNTVTLSESAGNFEYLGVYVNIEGTGLTAPMFYKCMQRNSDPYGTVIRAGGDVCKSITAQEYQLYSWGGEVAIKGTSCQIGNFYRFHFNGGGLVDSTNLVRLYRVVGIHRIANN